MNSERHRDRGDGDAAPDHHHPHGEVGHPHPHGQSADHDTGAGEDEAARRAVDSAAPRQRPALSPARPTPLVYVDCCSGVAGDMLLGALLDAGLPLAALTDGLAALDVHGYRLDVRPKTTHGVAGTKLDVLVDEAVQPERRLRDILALLERSSLPPWVRSTAEAVFRRLARAEAAVHASTPDEVHFHEVGAVDSIVDVVGSLIGFHELGIRRFYASSLPLPGGTVRAAHGLLPAPAPATLEILAEVGAPTRPAPVLGELVTPTGAAILAELASFEQPTMRVHRVGYGYGTRELDWPNVVRIWLGEAWRPAPPRLPGRVAAPARPRGVGSPTPPATDLEEPVDQRIGGASPAARGMPTSTETASSGVAPAPDRVVAADALPQGVGRDDVVVLEANIDDMTPELLGYAMERLFAAGALDVTFSPLLMKKQRPATLVTVICRPDAVNPLAAVVLRETATLGVRLRRTERLVAERRLVAVETPFGPVRVKLKLLDGDATPAPEYEDCAALARQHDVPLAEIYRAALLAATGLR